MDIEKVGKLIGRGWGDKVLIGVLISVLKGTTPDRCYQYIREDIQLFHWVTDDNWSTYTEYEPLIEDVNGTVEQVFYTDPSLYESVVYGGYDFPIGIPTHILGGVTSLSDETVAGVCGDNSDTPPYTNSIPNDEIITWVGSVYFHYSNLLGTNLWDGLYT